MHEKEIREAREHGEMPRTALHGYIYEWDGGNENRTTEQNERVHQWWIMAINEELPDYAEWFESTSEILLPIDKVDEFCENVEWNDILQRVYEKFLENESDIVEHENFTKEELDALWIDALNQANWKNIVLEDE